MTTPSSAPGGATSRQGLPDDAAAHQAVLRGERLSALLDGELDESGTRDACARWQADADCRRDWHSWHVIGDVLRSEELAIGADGDVAFLSSLRLRMAAEPIVLAPAPLPATVAARRRSRWLMPGAAAAGFVLVAGTFVALRVGDTGTGALVADRSGAGAAGAVPVGAVNATVPTAAVRTIEPDAATSGRVIRDARLDRYLAAHKQFAGSTAPVWPQAAIRNATVQVEGR